MKAGGYSWDKVGKIWHIPLEDRSREYSIFQEAADNTYDIASIFHSFLDSLSSVIMLEDSNHFRLY
jgi:hypothetical protein